MRKEEFYFDSNCNTNKIHAVKWVPEGTPLCIVQIVHGMAEHMGRYEEFAAFLTERNILVVGEDLLGHGLSMGENPPGYFCKNNPGKVLVEDMRTLKNIMRAEYPDIPYIVFGHSMGSFIVRNFIHAYGKEVEGAILSGTGMLPKALLNVLAVMLRITTALHGPRHISPFINKLAFGGYLKRIENPKTESDWLTTDDEQVQIFLQDPLCGFSLTLNGFRGMEELIRGLYDREKIAVMDKDFPMYFFFGEEDPVGDYGVSAYKSCQVYKKAGMQKVHNIVYPGKRHELLHEDIREDVMQDIFEWIRKVIE